MQMGLHDKQVASEIILRTTSCKCLILNVRLNHVIIIVLKMKRGLVQAVLTRG